MVYPILKIGLWVVAGVLALSFFGISLQAIVNSPAGQENFAYLWYLLVAGWVWLVALANNFIS